MKVFFHLYFFLYCKPIGIWQKLKNVVLGDNNDNNNENNNDMDENQTDDLKKRKIYSIQNQKCMLLTLLIFFCSE